MPEPIAGSAAAPARFEPRIVAFFCNWCTYTAADLAGVSRMKYEPTTRVVRVMCSGRIDPQFILSAFAKGADGVLIGGCHPGDCHYIEGNYKMLRRFRLMRRMLAGPVAPGQPGIQTRKQLGTTNGNESTRMVRVGAGRHR